MPLSAADVKPANACNSASNLAFATVPDSWEASIVLFVSVCVADSETSVELLPAGNVNVLLAPTEWACAVSVCAWALLTSQ